jgi:2,5-diamino-6-(ribosylamino)-4(3H)-pyrimidinone 5'-phosphate reductase
MLPEVIIHSVTSLNGKIEGFGLEAVGQYYELSAQLNCDTWLIGADTLLDAERAPDFVVHQIDREAAPLQAVAENGGILIAVPDSRGRIRNWHTHVNGIGARGAVALISAATPRPHVDYLRTRRVPFIETGEDHVDYRSALSELNTQFGCRRIRTDSGGVLNSILLEEGVATELSLLIAPELTGGTGRDLFRTLKPAASLRLRMLDCQRTGQGFIWLRYKVGTSDARQAAP